MLESHRSMRQKNKTKQLVLKTFFFCVFQSNIQNARFYYRYCLEMLPIVLTVVSKIPNFLLPCYLSTLLSWYPAILLSCYPGSLIICYPAILLSSCLYPAILITFFLIYICGYLSFFISDNLVFGFSLKKKLPCNANI